MSDTIRETSPMITPDSLRKINQTNKAFYEMHTKKNFGRTDVLGSQYSGTVENFGFEMLLEARKQKMEKPSLEGIFEINNYKYYFDLQYSNMIETYEQQGMLEAVLKKDVFLSNKEYRIKFVDCEDICIPRSESWGSLNDDTPSKVFKDNFIYTNSAPILIIRDIESDTTEEIELKLEVQMDYESDYYFYNGFSTQKFIESYEDGILITKQITNEDAELPFVWICVEIFKSLPPVDFIGNEPEGEPILTIGVDGHNVSHIYPCIYGRSSLPDYGVPGEWYISAYSELDGFIPERTDNNNSKISNIYYVFKPAEGSDIANEITFEEDYIKITLSDKVEWEITRDSMNSPYYAITPLSQFIETNGTSDPTMVLLESFDVKFSDEYLYYPYEGLCEEAESGVHIDIHSDLSDNSVPKKNGTIRSLGDFDGLPSYFQKFHGTSVHRSHVELYAIRDRLNRRTQKTTEKQTAAILLDSAMPQDELNVLDQEPAIIYQYDPDSYLYITDMDKVVSKKNVVSEITFNDENTFGNIHILSDANRLKFIYHGNRTFSLGSIEYDNELETARVYYVNNDSLKYVNNASLDDEDKKAPLTVARICDIPTEYEQLMHLHNKSATYLFDFKYVRTESSFDFDDLELIRNDRRFKVVMTPGPVGDQWIYDPSNRIPLPTKQDLIDCGYVRTDNIGNVNINISDSNFDIFTSGSGYDIGDTFYVLVGGVAYDGVVTSTILQGNVTGFDITVPDDSSVSVYNLDGVHTQLKTITTSSEYGNGFQLELSVSQNDINTHLPKANTVIPPTNLVAFAFDIFGNIFLYELQYDWTWKKICQVEGDEVRENVYDYSNRISVFNRDFNYAFFKYLLDNQYTADDAVFFDSLSYIDQDIIHDYPNARGHKGSSDKDDLSEYIVEKNMGNTYYKLDCYDSSDNGHFDLKTYSLKSLDGFETILPRFNLNNTVDYFNPSNRLLISHSDILNEKQPSLFTYSPIHDIAIDNRRIMTDVILANSYHVMTYNDYGSDIVNRSGRLESNVYYYPEYEFSDKYIDAKNEYMSMQRSELITFIRDTFGSGAEPFIYEDTEYAYSHDSLVEYIMMRYPMNGPYVKDGLKIHNYAGDQVIDPATQLPISKHPTGGVIPLTSEVIFTKVTADRLTEESEPVNIFIIEDVSFQGFTDDFKVYDENGVDVTSTAIIIWNHDKYIFRGEWIKLAKPVTEGYYNQYDRMFYYDDQYLDQIIPDTDITYCDISTGQYYKWNGVSYILIVF